MFKILLFLSVFLTFLLVPAIYAIGRYWAIRLLGIKNIEVSYGLGPDLLKFRTRLGVWWKLKLLPVGTYLSMRENPKKNLTTKYIENCLIVISGILSIAAASLVILVVLQKIEGIITIKPVVAFTHENSLSRKGGVLPGDVIVAIDDVKIADIEELTQYFLRDSRKPLNLKIRRPGEELKIPINMTSRSFLSPDDRVRHLGIEFIDLPENAIVKEISVENAGRRALKKFQLLIIEGWKFYITDMTFEEKLNIKSAILLGSTTNPRKSIYIFMDLIAHQFFIVAFWLFISLPFLILWQQYWRYRLLM